MGATEITFHFPGNGALIAIRLTILLRDFSNDFASLLRSVLLIWSEPSALFTSKFKLAVLVSLGKN